MTAIRGRAWGLAVAGLLAPSTAHAHLVNTGLGPLYDGMSHFVLTPEDFVPALALALLAGQRGPRAGRLALLSLPTAWLAGGLLGLAFPSVASLPLVPAVAFVVLGGLVAAEARLAAGWVVALSVLVGCLLGVPNGAAMAQSRLGALAVVGIVAPLFVLVAFAAATVVALSAAWTRIAIRVAGSWIGASGLLLLGWALRSS